MNYAAFIIILSCLYWRVTNSKVSLKSERWQEFERNCYGKSNHCTTMKNIFSHESFSVSKRKELDRCLMRNLRSFFSFALADYADS